MEASTDGLQLVASPCKNGRPVGSIEQPNRHQPGKEDVHEVAPKEFTKSQEDNAIDKAANREVNAYYL